MQDRDNYIFRCESGIHRLYFNDRLTNMRIYPVQRGDEPVMLAPGGRIVPSAVWYGEGWLEDNPLKKRRYFSEESALEGELKLITERLGGSMEETDSIEAARYPAYRAISKDRFAYVLEIEAAEADSDEIDDVEVDTGFTVEKSGDEWKILYDGEVWASAKTWDDVYSVMSNINLYVADIISKGPNALKGFTAYYKWKDNDRDKSKILFDGGTDTGFVIQSIGGDFLCYQNGACLNEIFPTMEAAQTEAKLRYTVEKFDSMMRQIGVGGDEEDEDDYL
jgi:hypothetical protein